MPWAAVINLPLYYPLPTQTHDVEHKEWLETSGDICIRMVELSNVGDFIPQHSHDHGHTTLIASGAVRAWIDGIYVGDFNAPCLRYVEPNKDHTYQAIKPNTVMACISKQEQ